jgi:hypothetical protein
MKKADLFQTCFEAESELISLICCGETTENELSICRASSFVILQQDTPNFMVKWLTFPLCIWEVLGSNLDLETGYRD